MTEPRRKRMGRGRWLQVVSQLLALGFIFYAAFGAHWRNFKEAHNSGRIVGLMTNDVNAVLYAWNDRFLNLFGDSAVISDGFLGGPWAAEVFGLPLTDPWNAATVTLQAGSAPVPMLVGALVPLLLALLLGKVFCSFLCPARLAFEVSSAVRLGLLRLGSSSRRSRGPASSTSCCRTWACPRASTTRSSAAPRAPSWAGSRCCCWPTWC
ncbi:MAG: 4Fe-4S binding protein [Proteobacteria bacterium]|nr:4Fe-4S binding protein [Pseudomonadota bacterium]